MCKVESFVSLTNDPTNDDYETVEKIDMSKFRAAFTYVNVKEGLKNDLIQGRIRKAELEQERELEKNTKKKKHGKKVNGMTAEELAAKRK